MNKTLLAAYREARKPRHMVYHTHAYLWATTAKSALQQARHALETQYTRQQFELLGEDCVRIRYEPEEWLSFDDLAGDMFEPSCYPFNPNGIEAAKQAYIDRINSDGVWYVVSEYWSDVDNQWVVADSIGCIEGIDDDICGYAQDLMQSAITGFIEANEVLLVA